MKQKRLLTIGGILVILVVLIRICDSSSQWVENTYSNGIYPPLARTLRAIFGWIPFSFGDIIYGSLVIFIIWRVIRGIMNLVKKRVTRRSFGIGLVRFVGIFMIIYVCFNLLWGINYNRNGIASQLQLKLDAYTKADLEQVNALLVEKVNTAKDYLAHSNENYPSSRELFDRVNQAYKTVDSIYPFLHYQTVSIKPSIWGWLGNYTGFTGYYNPFTGEAQVNTTVPKFLQPYICCHEVAHQLGYAKEMEANFVGYLAASASHDTLFHYSVYLDLFTYSNRNLFAMDSASARKFASQLSPAVKADVNIWRAFVRRHKNPFEPIIRWAYGKYLESNNQPQGVLAYDEVTSFLIAYYKKYGKI